MWLQPQLVVGVLALASTGAGYAPRLPHARPPLGGARFNPPRASTPMEQQQRQQQQRQQQQQQQQQALEPLVVDKQARQQQVADALQALLPSRSRVDEVSRRGGESDALRAQPLQGTTEAMAAAGDEAALRRHAELVEKSYEQCRLITKQYAATFYFGTKFFEIEKRRAVWAVYAWCRRTDDIVDKPRKDSSSLRDELDQWQARLEDLWRHRAHDLIDLALVDTIRNYPEMAIEPFEDMIKGMVMDLDQNRFKTFDELYVYCYRVAGTVGVMMMPIMGTAEGASFEEALEPALALGVALQLTNILRDVGEDRARKRIYLPQEDLARFGVEEADLLRGVKDEKYVALIKFQIDRARDWYNRAEAGIQMLSPDCQLPIRASLDMYSSILDKIESNQYDNFNKRAYTAKWEKLLMLPRSYLSVKGVLPPRFS